MRQNRLVVLAATMALVGALTIPKVGGDYSQALAGSLAKKSLNPRVFRLPLSDFPAHAKVHVNRVESNIQADRDFRARHFGGETWKQEGRLTGYAMKTTAQAMDSNGQPQTITVDYLVSIFLSREKAQRAWQLQKSGWPDSSPICGSSFYGSGGFDCTASQATSQQVWGEDYFVWGRVLIESFDADVNNGDESADPADTGSEIVSQALNEIGKAHRHA